MPGSDILRYEKSRRVVTITLDRPEAMNALSVRLRHELDEAMGEFTRDNDALVAILTGAGGRAFSAGADLKEMSQTTAPADTTTSPWTPDPETAVRRDIPGFIGIDRTPKPVIAAIDGYCLAGGFELALYSDIRLATTSSSFGLPEPRRSLLAGPGLINLSRMIPLGEALRMQLTGTPITAERAHQIGLVQELLPDREALFDRATALAEEILACAPLAVQFIKRIVRGGRDLPVDAQWQLSDMYTRAIAQTDDMREGPRAFAEKRAPRWTMS